MQVPLMTRHYNNNTKTIYGILKALPFIKCVGLHTILRYHTCNHMHILTICLLDELQCMYYNVLSK